MNEFVGFFGGRVTGSIRKIVVAAASSLNLRFGSGDEQTERRRHFLSLIRSVLEYGGRADRESYAVAAELLADDFGRAGVSFADEVSGSAAVPVAAAAAGLSVLTLSEKSEMLRLLLSVAVAAHCRQGARTYIAGLASAIGISEAELEDLQTGVELSLTRRQRILRSGAGIAVALGVILVFIVTATLLRSVIFGLILAYVLLPLEKYFERSLASGGGIWHGFIRLLKLTVAPLEMLAERIRRSCRKNAVPPSGQDEIAKKQRRQIISQSVFLTCLVIMLFIAGIIAAVSMLAGGYMSSLKAKVADVQQEVVADAGNGNLVEKSSLRLLDHSKNYLETLRSKVENLPLIRMGVEYAARVLNDESARRQFIAMVIRRTGGFFSFTAGFVGVLVSLLSDLLLTVFFFLLFIAKFAEFCHENRNCSGQQSELLVRTVFNGSWLPGASRETVLEARRIVGGVIDKLRIWVRGYLILILVDTTVYTTVFALLGIPYFMLLGPLAGCGILLPYIGPVLSATVTCIVVMASGGSGTQLLLTLSAYLLYNGIVEQFILYPAVIGESLGLSTLETIIVVLLGAVFAGLSGMVLALPAAAVLKYLVPQIYRCWKIRSPAADAGEKSEE